MKSSIWEESLGAFYRELAEPTPAPAAVTASAVSARLGLALLIKTLRVVERRKSFAGDRQRLSAMIEAALEESAALARAADEDITGEPERKQRDIPMQAARAADAGLALCIEARSIVTGAVAADLESANLLLAAAQRAILHCVNTNDAQARRAD
jgi:formiminotetrahydrofolate cyclodeaminase